MSEQIQADLSRTVSDETQLSGRTLYSPTVIAVYCVLASFLVAFVLYGINVYRRGQLWIGRLYIGLSIIVFLGFVISAFSGSAVLNGVPFILSIVIAVGLYKIELKPFEKALAQGAVRAKWWPPLLWVILIVLAYLAFLILIVQAQEES